MPRVCVVSRREEVVEGEKMCSGVVVDSHFTRSSAKNEGAPG